MDSNPGSSTSESLLLITSLLWEEDVDTKYHFQQRSYLQSIPSMKGKISFLHWSATECIKHNPEQVPFPGCVGQHYIDSMCFCFALLFLNLLIFFFYIFFLSVCFDFRCFDLCFFESENVKLDGCEDEENLGRTGGKERI